MKIGLVSDTHIPDAGTQLPEQLFDAFSDAGIEMILHAGDIYNPECLDWLERIAPVHSCEGNGDFFRKIKDRRIERAPVLEIEGFKVGVTHGLAIPEMPPVRTVESVMNHEFGGPVDVIVSPLSKRGKPKKCGDDFYVVASILWKVEIVPDSVGDILPILNRIWQGSLTDRYDDYIRCLE